MTFDKFQLEKMRLSLSKILNSCSTQMKGLETHVALLESKGDLIDIIGPNALHFSAIEATVKAAKLYLLPRNGETLITNDPYSGNTRMCDLLLIQGAFGKTQANELRYFVALGLSLPQLLNKGTGGLATSVEDEGYRIPPTHLEAKGTINPEIVNYLCQSKMDAATLTDILSKGRKALAQAATELISLEAQLGRENFVQGLMELKQYSEKMMRQALKEIPDGEYSASEVLESDGMGTKSLKVQCKLTVQGENILVSFLGTSKQTKGPYNCNYAMTLGSCFWVFRSLLKRNIPINGGAFKAFSIEAPEGTLVNAKYPAPLLGGYFETTKRIVDTLFVILNKALPSEVPAQNGSSSNLCAIKFDDLFYAEVLGNGAGATKLHHGASVLLTELHNTPVSSVEDIERKFPLQVVRSHSRLGSGGEGKFNGGDGLTRGLKFLKKGIVTLLSDRRSHKPRGLFGGASGMAGEVTKIVGATKHVIEDKQTVALNEGDILMINTPGGGGWGKKEEPE